MSKTVVDGIDYGPLVLLAGFWRGDKGMDVAPESDGTTEKNPFYEETLFELAGDLSNANRQKLAIVRYHQKVYRKSNNEQFHDQLGYWLWDAADQRVMHTLVIPRGVALVAAGTFDPAGFTGDSVTLQVRSEDGGEWGIAQSAFMRDNARTTAFDMTMEVKGHQMTYSETTYLDIYGRKFDHTDNSILFRDSGMVSDD